MDIYVKFPEGMSQATHDWCLYTRGRDERLYHCLAIMKGVLLSRKEILSRGTPICMCM